MAKMTMMGAIARSVGNKAKITLHKGTDDEYTLIVQQLAPAQFHWWQIDQNGGLLGENQRDVQGLYQYLRQYGIDPLAKVWLSVECDEDAIDPEDLLSALQTAAYELGRDGKCLAASDTILRQEARRTLEHLQDVLKRYHRSI